jgi:hypothetical protein
MGVLKRGFSPRNKNVIPIASGSPGTISLFLIARTTAGMREGPQALLRKNNPLPEGRGQGEGNNTKLLE